MLFYAFFAVKDDCRWNWIVREYLMAYSIVSGISWINESAICYLATQGSIVNKQPRKPVSTLCHIDFILALIDFTCQLIGIYATFGDPFSQASLQEECNRQLPTASIVMLHLVVIWGLITSAGYFFIIGIVLYSSRTKRSGKVNMIKYMRLWQRRVQWLCSGPHNHKREGQQAILNVSREFADYFKDVDWSPTDIAVGLILLKREQKLAREFTEVHAATSPVATQPHATQPMVLSLGKELYSDDPPPPVALRQRQALSTPSLSPAVALAPVGTFSPRLSDGAAPPGYGSSSNSLGSSKLMPTVTNHNPDNHAADGLDDQEHLKEDGGVREKTPEHILQSPDDIPLKPLKKQSQSQIDLSSHSHDGSPDRPHEAGVPKISLTSSSAHSLPLVDGSTVTGASDHTHNSLAEESRSDASDRAASPTHCIDDESHMSNHSASTHRSGRPLMREFPVNSESRPGIDRRQIDRNVSKSPERRQTHFDGPMPNRLRAQTLPRQLTIHNAGRQDVWDSPVPISPTSRHQSKRQSIQSQASSRRMSNSVDLRDNEYFDSYFSERQHITREQIIDVLHFAHYAEIAYMNFQTTNYKKIDLLIHVSPKNDLYMSPYMISFDHDWNAIVIAIRGTYSAADVLVDLCIDLDALPTLEEADHGRVVFVHSGMLRAAENIHREIDKDQHLSRGVAALLAYFLRKDGYLSTRCYAYEPPGSLLSAEAVPLFEQFCVSVVTGDDLVPRLSRNSMDILKMDVDRLINANQIPKYRVFGSVLFNACSGPSEKTKLIINRLRRREAGEPAELPADALERIRSQTKSLPTSWRHGTTELTGDMKPHESTIPIEKNCPPMYMPGRLLYIEKLRGFSSKHATPINNDRLMTQARRVVVTGLGLVTPLGCGVDAVWRRLVAGDCGVVSLRGRTHAATGLSYAELPSQVAALVPTDPSDPLAFNAAASFSKTELKQMSPYILYAMHAARQALADANWNPKDDRLLERTGVCVGSGIGCMDDLMIATTSAAQSQTATASASASTTSTSTTGISLRKISPYFVPRLLINMAAGHISISHGFKGPNHAVSTACTTGAHAIGDAMRFIQYGDADVMVAGGTEASVSPLAMAGFAKARSLATRFNDSPAESSRPFDRDRDGFVIGEGAGIVVLEELEHARKRGAHIYAEIKGYGLTGDAHHITAPPSEGQGASRAMRRALEIANLDPSQIDYINAHATSTGLGDEAESLAINSVFGPTVAVSSTKGAIGHLLGAAGAVEAIFTILAIKQDVLPPTLNLHNLEPEHVFCLDYVKRVARDVKHHQRRCGHGTGVHAAISNSFGFGGTNASLCFAKLQ
eukprot:jgi/Hompol1/367/HPOL_002148-RA